MRHSTRHSWTLFVQSHSGALAIESQDSITSRCLFQSDIRNPIMFRVKSRFLKNAIQETKGFVENIACNKEINMLYLKKSLIQW